MTVAERQTTEKTVVGVEIRVEMAASTRLGGPAVTNVANLASRGQNIFPQAFPTASVSVGQDDWANQVIDNVVGSSQDWSETREDILKKTIVEKKRLFHNHRNLELKNLPDGVTEQVKIIKL